MKRVKVKKIDKINPLKLNELDEGDISYNYYNAAINLI
jgi:hypothetical protein